MVGFGQNVVVGERLTLTPWIVPTKPGPDQGFFLLKGSLALPLLPARWSASAFLETILIAEMPQK